MEFGVLARRDQQLQGASNYLRWRREFERAVIIEGLVNIFDGTATKYARNLNLHDYKVYVEDGSNENRRYDLPATEFKFAQARRCADAYHERLRMARTLLFNWLSGDLVDLVGHSADPHDAICTIQACFGTPDKYVRDKVLNDAETLCLSDCKSLHDYLNQHQGFFLDLQNSGAEYTREHLVGNILRGLPQSYHQFKEHFEWECLKQPEVAHNPDFLTELLTRHQERRAVKLKEMAKGKIGKHVDNKGSTTNREDNKGNKDNVHGQDKISKRTIVA